MAKKKKKRKKKWYQLPFKESPTAIDLYRESKEQKRNQDEYFGCF